MGQDCSHPRSVPPPGATHNTASLVSLDEVIGKVNAHLRKDLVLDSSRTEFAKLVATTLHSLLRGGLVGKNRYCQLLLGRKMVGKTTLLESLQAAAKTLDQRLRVSMFVSGHHAAGSPVNLIRSAMGLPVRNDSRTPTERVADLCEEMEERGLYAFVVFDELQDVFLSSDPGAKQFIFELSSIGESKKGRIFCVLTGSSSALPQLCFAKLAPALRPSYPAYTGIDMNSIKFQPFYIAPFLEPADFQRLVAHYSPAATEDEAFLSEVFVRTGGCPGLVSIYVERPGSPPDPYTVSSKGIGSAGADDLESRSEHSM